MYHFNAETVEADLSLISKMEVTQESMPKHKQWLSHL